MKDTNYNHGCRVISLSHNHGLVADIKDKWNELQERVESVDLEKVLQNGSEWGQICTL